MGGEQGILQGEQLLVSPHESWTQHPVQHSNHCLIGNAVGREHGQRPAQHSSSVRVLFCD